MCIRDSPLSLPLSRSPALPLSLLRVCAERALEWQRRHAHAGALQLVPARRLFASALRASSHLISAPLRI
eukprot:3333403-Rhodomonas_salina.1